jgi:hypothetical protein
MPSNYPPGGGGSTSPATPTNLGIAKLSSAASDPANPVVVETTDPAYQRSIALEALMLRAQALSANNGLPLASVTTNIYASLAATDTSTHAVSITMDATRGVWVTFTTDWTGGGVFVTGTDQNGGAQTETLTFQDSSNTITRGSKFWQTVTSVTNNTAGTTGTCSVTYGSLIFCSHFTPAPTVPANQTEGVPLITVYYFSDADGSSGSGVTQLTGTSSLGVDVDGLNKAPNGHYLYVLFCSF